MAIIFRELLPLILPILMIDLFLKIYSLQNIYKSTNKTKQAKFGWAILVCVLSLIGPVLYLFAGREEY